MAQQLALPHLELEAPTRTAARRRAKAAAGPRTTATPRTGATSRTAPPASGATTRATSRPATAAGSGQRGSSSRRPAAAPVTDAIPGAPPRFGGYRLDEHTRRVGLQGVEEARRALAAVAHRPAAA